MKALSVKLQDSTGMTYRWAVERTQTPLAVCATGKPIRHATGWFFTDHDGYARFSEGNWMALVYQLKLVAENYGLTLMSELN